MRINANQRIILGSPGTGKTTRLLSIVEEELKTVAPNRIAYCSFTKQAVGEAIGRACSKFNFSEDDLPYFRTLHSLCFQLLGLRRKDVLQRRHYQELGEDLGYTFADYDAPVEDGYMSIRTDGDRLLYVCGLARNRLVTLEQQWHDINDPDIDMFALKRLQYGLQDYKKQQGLIDFTDMLEELVKSKRALDIDVVVLDEAQDLSPLQWEVCKALFPKAKRVYIGGDDDQAVFSWSGADVKMFLALEGEREVLRTSYRLPIEVFKVANQVIERVSQRFAKEWKPRNERGSVTRLPHIEMLDFETPGTWMLLARNGYMLSEMTQQLKRAGIVYTSQKGGSSVSNEHYLAIKTWEQLRKGQRVPGAMVKRVYDYLRPGVGIKRGYKDLDRFSDENTYGIEILRQNHGLVAEGIWHDALDGISLNTREYYLSVLRAGGKLSESPKVSVSTIHGAKGGEADNVVMLTDMSYRTYQNYQKNPDDELRCAYVGLTRARHNLFIIDASGLEKYDI